MEIGGEGDHGLMNYRPIIDTAVVCIEALYGYGLDGTIIWHLFFCRLPFILISFLDIESIKNSPAKKGGPQSD
jgi:hypothetical protein